MPESNEDKIIHQQLVKYAEDVSRVYKELKEENRRLQETQRELEENYYETVLMGFDLINLYDEFLGGHCRRVAYYADLLGKRLEIGNLRLNDLKIAALLHDIELIGIPPRKILLFYSTDVKKLPEMYVKHPVVHIRPIASSERFKNVASIIAAHHEYFNGTGFPNRLKSTAIPLESRILTVVDHYDIHRNVKASRISPDRVIEQLAKDAGIAFDPEVFIEFKRLIVGDDDPFKEKLRIAMETLREGMILAEPVITTDGVKLLGADTVITNNYLDRVQSYIRSGRLKSEVDIYKPRQKEEAADA